MSIRHEKFTRRSALRITSVGGMAAAVGGKTTKAISKTNFDSFSKALPKMLRSDAIKVAAVQLVPSHTPKDGNGMLLEQMITAVHSVQAQSGMVDLVSFFNPTFENVASARLDMTGLAECTKRFGCYLSCGAGVTTEDKQNNVANFRILIDPRGRAIVANCSKPLIHSTDIGILALPSGSQTPDSLKRLSDSGAEIIIRSEPSGYSRWETQAASAPNAAYSVVVSDVKPSSGITKPATAILGPTGEVLTETSGIWEQTVVATIPISALRAHRRSEHIDYV